MRSLNQLDGSRAREWADPISALVIIPLVIWEGREAMRGKACGCCQVRADLDLAIAGEASLRLCFEIGTPHSFGSGARGAVLWHGSMAGQSGPPLCGLCFSLLCKSDHS